MNPRFSAVVGIFFIFFSTTQQYPLQSFNIKKKEEEEE